MNNIKKIFKNIILIKVHWSDGSFSNFSGHLRKVDYKNVLITAKHCIYDEEKEIVSIYDNTLPLNPKRIKWSRIVMSDNNDLAAIIADWNILSKIQSPKITNEYSVVDEVYLLGYPNGYRGSIQDNFKNVSPFIRKGIISSSSNENFYIDSISYGGDSGGVVIKMIDEEPNIIGIVVKSLVSSKSERMNITGVVSSKYINKILKEI